MPSYRVTLTIGNLRSGVAPESLLPAAAAAGKDLTTVESYDVGVVSGQARITVRFTADDNPTAERVGDHVAATTGALATVLNRSVTRRYGARWHPLRS
jgi:hypothetical protein